MLSTASPPPQSDALRRLLDSILAGDDVTLFIRSDDGRALLDAAADCLSALRCRALRAAGTPEEGLSLPALMTQVTGQPYLSARNDEFLKRGFQALTALDETCDRVVLLVSDANTLQPAALRYIQLACRAGTTLQLVLAGRRGFLDLLSPNEFAHLRERLATGPIISPPRPAAAPTPALAVDAASPVSDMRESLQPAHDHAAPEQAWLRPAPPELSSFSDTWYRRLAAVTGIGLAVAGCIALGVWASGSGARPAPSQEAALVIEPPVVLAKPAAPPETQPASEPASAPEAAQPQPQPQPPATTDEASVAILPPPGLPQPIPAQPPALAAVPALSLPKNTGRRSAVVPRIAAARPSLSAGSVAAWENPYPSLPLGELRPVSPAQAMSRLPEQPQSYIGTYTTDANGVRAFRFSR